MKPEPKLNSAESRRRTKKLRHFFFFTQIALTLAFWILTLISDYRPHGVGWDVAIVLAGVGVLFLEVRSYRRDCHLDDVDN